MMELPEFIAYTVLWLVILIVILRIVYIIFINFKKSLVFTIKSKSYINDKVKEYVSFLVVLFFILGLLYFAIG